MATINNQGWHVHGSVALPEIERIIQEDNQVQAAEYFNQILLPEAYLSKPMGQLKVLGAGQDRKVIKADRAFDGGYARVKWVMGEDFYTSAIYGIEAAWDNMEAINNKSIQIDERTQSAKVAVGILKMSREARVAEAFFNETAWSAAGYLKDESGSLWDASATLPLIRGKIETAIEAGMATKFGIRIEHCTATMHRDLIHSIATNIGATAEYYSNNELMALKSIDEKRRIVANYLGLANVISISSLYNRAYMQFIAQNKGEANFADMYNPGHVWVGRLSEGGTGEGVLQQGGMGFQTVFSAITKDYKLEEYPEPRTDGYVVRAKEQRGIKVDYNWGYLFYKCVNVEADTGHVGSTNPA